jgi:hypothetical protein
MLERLGRDEEALGIYAYSVHRYRDNPNEFSKARTYYSNILQKVGKGFFDIQEFVAEHSHHF